MLWWVRASISLVAVTGTTIGDFSRFGFLAITQSRVFGKEDDTLPGSGNGGLLPVTEPKKMFSSFTSKRSVIVILCP